MRTIKADVEKNQVEKNSIEYQKRSHDIKRKLARAVEIHCQAYEWVDTYAMDLD